MGHAAVRRRGHDVSQPGLPARRRVPVRPADLRDLRRLLGRGGRSGHPPHRSGPEHSAPVRGIDHTHRSEVVGHHRPLRRPRDRHRRSEGRAGRRAAGAHGSGAPIRWLLDNQLVDEITLFVCPWSSARGARLFPDTGPDAALDLVESQSTPKGVTIQVYRPSGRPQYGTGTFDLEHVT